MMGNLSSRAPKEQEGRFFIHLFPNQRSRWFVMFAFVFLTLKPAPLLSSSSLLLHRANVDGVSGPMLMNRQSTDR